MMDRAFFDESIIEIVAFEYRDILNPGNVEIQVFGEIGQLRLGFVLGSFVILPTNRCHSVARKAVILGCSQIK